MKITTALSILALALCPTVHAAQNPEPTKETVFVKKATLGGMTEVETGKLAETNAAAADVKDFGKMMVADHTKANGELTEIVTAEKIEAPKKLDEKHQMIVDRLSKLQGKDFDAAYIKQMVTDHEKTVALFEMAAKNLSDPKLKAFAEKTLPTLKMHLKKIQEIASANS